MTRSLRNVGTLIAAALAVAAALFASLPSAAQPVPPNRFFGQVFVNGQPGVLAEIRAYVNNVECGRAKADQEGKYRVDVISHGEKEGCGTPGAPVGFTVNGARANGVANWQQGEFTPFDIIVGGGVFAQQRTSPVQSQTNTRLIAIIVAVAAVAFVAVGTYLFLRARRTTGS